MQIELNEKQIERVSQLVKEQIAAIEKLCDPVFWRDILTALNPPAPVANLIDDYCKRNGLSVVALASLLDITPRTLHKYKEKPDRVPMIVKRALRDLERELTK